MGSGSGEGAGTGTGVGGESAVPLAYALTEYVNVSEKIWKSLLHISAIDSTSRLFVSDGQTIYAVKDGLPSIYLGADDLKAALGGTEQAILSIDVGPDDRLYILVNGYPSTVLVSAGPHDVAIHLTWTDEPFVAQPTLIGVVSVHNILLPGSAGLYSLGPDGAKHIYTKDVFPDANGCEGMDLAATPDNHFYFLPCDTTGLMGGIADGSDVHGIAKLADLKEYYFWRFAGVARHPQGGAVVNLEGTAYYFDKTGTATELTMSPAMDTIESTSGVLGLFVSRPIEVGPDGDIYLIGGDRIYRATPL